MHVVQKDLATCVHDFQAYQRLERLHLTLSYKALSRLLLAIGENHDLEVLEWKDSFIPLLMEVCISVYHSAI